MKKILFFALALLMTACEKPILSEEDIVSTQDANVILHFKQYEQESFTRAATDITELCSRLNIAIFDADGTKVKTVAQKESDAGYGTVALTLASGTYQLVVIAHNCEGSATITSTEKVTFPNNKVTDTFYYYGDLVVTSEVQSYDLTLTRAVAMFRLVLTDDEMPANVAKMKFYYLGGSSSTIALTRQEDNRTWTLPSLSGEGSSAALPSHQGEGPGVGSVFLLPPSSQPASVSVNITIGGTTKTYTYSCSDQLEAGYKINIDISNSKYSSREKNTRILSCGTRAHFSNLTKTPLLQGGGAGVVGLTS